MNQPNPQSGSIMWQGIALPGFAAPLASVGKVRCDALLAHLDRLLPSSHAAYGPPSPTRRPVQSAGSPDACRACKGYCCRNGGDMAFLTDQALRVVWSEQPHTRKGDLIAAYANSIPDVASEGSCIFHAEHGCNLPDQLRSVICKTYLCDPLKEAQSTSA